MADIPESKKINLGTETLPDIRECFDINGFKKLLQTEHDANELQRRVTVLESKIKNRNEDIEVLEKIIKTQEHTISVTTLDRDRLYHKWITENRLRHEAENKPRFSVTLGWGLAGTFAVTSAVLAGIIILD